MMERGFRPLRAALATLDGVGRHGRAAATTDCVSTLPRRPGGTGRLRCADRRRGGAALRHVVVRRSRALRARRRLHHRLGGEPSRHCRQSRRTTGREVISVDYRLAPEADHAEMLADCHAVANTTTRSPGSATAPAARLVMDLAQRFATPPRWADLPAGWRSRRHDAGSRCTAAEVRDDVLSIRRLCPAALPVVAEPKPPAPNLACWPWSTTRSPHRWKPPSSAGTTARRTSTTVALPAWCTVPCTPTPCCRMQNAWRDFCQALRIAA
ncbi:hypothetical protein DSL92_03765 [Billgrantia gudaonensis]|uniref:Alpha/beta hydrolase fold-3 domain-containing protein n=1 Tax=Billgrantia gudaonensis TaxID=376427 RepID=A0A3S0QG69_9GAMM|nr:hypothetical protein DSL92_03765 [Halomonas gudaonensis]